MSQPGLIPSVRDLAGRARRRTAGAVHRRGPGAPSPFGAGIDLAADLADSLTPEEVVQRLLRRAVETVDADHGSLCRVEEDRLIVEAAYGRRGDLRRSRRAYPLSAYPLAGEVIRSRRLTTT